MLPVVVLRVESKQFLSVNKMYRLYLSRHFIFINLYVKWVKLQCKTYKVIKLIILSQFIFLKGSLFYAVFLTNIYTTTLNKTNSMVSFEKCININNKYTNKRISKNNIGDAVCWPKCGWPYLPGAPNGYIVKHTSSDAAKHYRQWIKTKQ